MYFYIFILCLNTMTSMIKTNAFFDLIDFQEFYREYLNPLLTARTKTKTTTSSSKRGPNKFRAQQRLFVMNPNKIAACRHLINVHTARNDKILVFSDDIFALRQYAVLLRVREIGLCYTCWWYSLCNLEYWSNCTKTCLYNVGC